MILQSLPVRIPESKTPRLNLALAGELALATCTMHRTSPPAVAVPRLQSSDAALHGQMLLFHLADQRLLTL